MKRPKAEDVAVVVMALALAYLVATLAKGCMGPQPLDIDPVFR